MIGEELGLRVSLLVVFLFVVIIVCGTMIALHAKDRFGLLLGCGVVSLLALQAAVNIGVTTSLLPNKGLPLPFISYGGSNLVVCLFGVGLLLNIYRQGVLEPANHKRTNAYRHASHRESESHERCHRMRRNRRSFVSRSGGGRSASRARARSVLFISEKEIDSRAVAGRDEFRFEKLPTVGLPSPFSPAILGFARRFNESFRSAARFTAHSSRK